MNYSPKLEEIDIEVEDGFQELIYNVVDEGFSPSSLELHAFHYTDAAGV